jgi:uncharacterized protein with PQ loop repeat
VIPTYNLLTFILGINSFILIGLILNQNDTSKDSIINPNISSSTNPFENITWISGIFQLSLLLIKIKINEF